ncbi:MAG: hypothetical protein RRA15_03605 [bacterium]|nr:hypothetical protein [bacterium]MDT8365561.1 hypothetical protein [bacterium]
MFRSPQITLIILFISTMLILPLSALGGDFSLTSRTSATSWEEEDGTTNSSASEYLKFYNRGALGGFRLDLEGYGRFSQLEEEWEPGDEPGDEDPNRLYVLAMTLSGENDRNVIILGRQFVTALVGPEMIDGLSIQTEAGKATFNARWGYRSDVSGGSEDDIILGLGFDYNIKQGMYLSLDYGRTYDDRTLSELLATEWVYSWHRFTKAYINLNWDLMSQTLHESLVGTRLFFSDRFSAVVEFAHNVQVFDSDSIYSVFAVDAAYTRSFSLLFTPSRNTKYAWDYVVESSKDGGAKRYVVSGHWTPGRSKIYSSLLQHTGTGGDVTEISASVSTPVFKNFYAGIGGDLATTENPGESSVKSHLAYLSGEWELGPNTSVDLRLEHCGDELTEPTRTARLALKVEF